MTEKQLLGSLLTEADYDVLAKRPVSAPPPPHGIFISQEAVEEDVDPSDLRCTAGYYQWYYSQQPRDPRVPVPIVRGWPSVKPDSEKADESGSSTAAIGNGTHLQIDAPKPSLVQRIQEDFPRTPSPVYTKDSIAQGMPVVPPPAAVATSQQAAAIPGPALHAPQPAAAFPHHHSHYAAHKQGNHQHHHHHQHQQHQHQQHGQTVQQHSLHHQHLHQHHQQHHLHHHHQHLAANPMLHQHMVGHQQGYFPPPPHLFPQTGQHAALFVPPPAGAPGFGAPLPQAAQHYQPPYTPVPNFYPTGQMYAPPHVYRMYGPQPPTSAPFPAVQPPLTHPTPAHAHMHLTQQQQFDSASPGFGFDPTAASAVTSPVVTPVPVVAPPAVEVKPPKPTQQPKQTTVAPAAAGAPAAVRTVPKAAEDAPRSKLMDEFRAQKTRKWEINDLVGHIVEFSKDQEGSRLIQRKLESAQCTADEKELVFQEVFVEGLSLMTDVFGNYVIQRLFEYGLPHHQKALIRVLSGNVLSLSLQTYGCRVIQKALEVSDESDQRLISMELDGNVLRCVLDQNGNHVIQKCIERIPPHNVRFIVHSFVGSVHNLAVHAYGCRVIQRILEYCEDHHDVIAPVLDEILEHVQQLVRDQFGNYVVQHVLINGKPKYQSAIIDGLRTEMVPLSQHKFASNVVEKMFQYGSQQDRDNIISSLLQVTPEGSTPLMIMVKDQYANYVVQKILDLADDRQKHQLVDHIRPHMASLRRFTYGKHIISRIEKMQ